MIQTLVFLTHLYESLDIQPGVAVSQFTASDHKDCGGARPWQPGWQVSIGTRMAKVHDIDALLADAIAAHQAGQLRNAQMSTAPSRGAER